MTNPETIIQRAVQVAASACGARLFRNMVGVFFDREGRHVRIGTVGSSDLIGWRSLTITPEMVGQRIAQFVACEIKTPRGRLSPVQAAYLLTVKNAGGLSVVARSENEIREALSKPPANEQ